MKAKDTQGTVQRAMKLRRMTSEYLRNMTPQQRDRIMQIHLAQARGSVGNGDLLRQAVDRALRIKVASKDPSVEMATIEDALVHLLSQVARALDDAGATYAVTGSIASIIDGEPSSSIDVDLLVDATPAQAASLGAALTPRFCAPWDTLTEAAEDGGSANVVDKRTSLKAVLSFVGGDRFLGQVLQRRARTGVGSCREDYWIATPEDVILMKLVWRKDTRSQKQWDNALSVARVQGARMDWKYLFEQAGKLGIEDDLTRLRDEAGI